MPRAHAEAPSRDSVHLHTHVRAFRKGPRLGRTNGSRLFRGGWGLERRNRGPPRRESQPCRALPTNWLTTELASANVRTTVCGISRRPWRPSRNLASPERVSPVWHLALQPAARRRRLNRDNSGGQAGRLSSTRGRLNRRRWVRPGSRAPMANRLPWAPIRLDGKMPQMGHDLRREQVLGLSRHIFWQRPQPHHQVEASGACLGKAGGELVKDGLW